MNETLMEGIRLVVTGRVEIEKLNESMLLEILIFSYHQNIDGRVWKQSQKVFFYKLTFLTQTFMEERKPVVTEKDEFKN